MYPEYSVVVTQQHKPRTNLWVGIVVAVMAMLSMGIYRLQSATTSISTITIRYSVAASDAIVSFNGKRMAAKARYTLAPGRYAVTITKPGYQKFSASFRVSAHETILLNARLLLADVPAIDTPTQLTLYSGVTGIQIVDTKYFSGNLWAVITMNTSDDDNTVVAAKYDTSAHSWATVLGPGTQFRQIDTSYLPADVQTYLMQTNHVNLGD